MRQLAGEGLYRRGIREIALPVIHAAAPQRQLANFGRKYRTTGVRSIRPNCSARGAKGGAIAAPFTSNLRKLFLTVSASPQRTLGL